MNLSDEEIAEAIEIQKRLAGKIEAYQKEIRYLERNYQILDAAITESSYKSAADIVMQQQEDSTDSTPEPVANNSGNQHEQSLQHQGSHETRRDPSADADADDAVAPTAGPNPTPIRCGSTGPVIANAYRTADHISIVMTPDAAAELTADVEPFGSFFIERILKGMQKKDAEDVRAGIITKESAIDYNIETDPKTGSITSIVIRNYRDERRATEIISTAGWSFARMLERVAPAESSQATGS